MNSSIKIVTFNVLASIYAHPDYYPDGLDDILLASYRREKIRNFLISLKNEYDVIALQEITDDTNDSCGEFAQIKEILAPEFIGIFCPHDKQYWSEWIHSDYSYLHNGNALFLKQTSFQSIIWSDISLKTGNHAVLAYVQHIGHPIRIVNIHLDSDIPNRQLVEYNFVLESLEADSEIIDIIVGDFNSGIIGNILDLTSKHKFKYDDNMIRTFSIIGSDRTKNTIDHIVYRSTHSISCVTEVDNNIWKRYPYNGDEDTYAAERCRECIETYGSDHIPLKAILIYHK